MTAPSFDIMKTLAVVMYRNPLEEWWWESGAAYYVAGFALVALLAWIAGAFICDWWTARKFRNRK